ncbi:Adenine nucleotide transporter BT1, chloroplastic/mitochondrial [Linum perenne]
MAKNKPGIFDDESILCLFSKAQILFYGLSNCWSIGFSLGLSDENIASATTELLDFVQNSSSSYFFALRDGYELMKQLAIFSGIELDPLFTRFAIYPCESFVVVPFVKNILAPLSCITLLSQSLSRSQQTVVSRQLEEIFRANRGWFRRGDLEELRFMFRRASMILEKHGGYNAVNWISTVHRLAYYGITLFVHFSLKPQLKMPSPGSDFELIKVHHVAYTAMYPLQANFVYGVLASLTATLITHPLDTLRTRIAVQAPKDYRGLWRSFVDICRDDGFKSLYAGLLPSILGIIPSMAISVTVYKTLSLAWGLQRSTPSRFMINLACSTIASLVASTATFPIQVVQRRMQVAGLEGSNNMDALLETVDTIVENEGVGGLYKGIQPHCFEVIFSHIISFVAYEIVRVPFCMATVSMCFAFDWYPSIDV